MTSRHGEVFGPPWAMKTALDGSPWAWVAVALVAALTTLGVWAFRGYLDPDALLWFSNLRLC